MRVLSITVPTTAVVWFSKGGVPATVTDCATVPTSRWKSWVTGWPTYSLIPLTNDFLNP